MKPDTSAGFSPAGLAYAMFELSAPEYGWPAIQSEWGEPTEEGSQIFFGLANFETNRWEFFQDTGDPIRPHGRDQYLDADDRMLMVVIATGTQERSLVRLWVNPFDPERATAEFDVVAAGYKRVDSIEMLSLRGRPAVFIAWQSHPVGEDSTEIGVDMVLADDAPGISWGDPYTVITSQQHAPGSDSLHLWAMQVAVVDGNPTLLWQFTQDPSKPTEHTSLLVMRAGDPLGTAWAEPNLVSSDFYNMHLVMEFAEVDGRPAYTYMTYENGDQVPYFHIATDALGTSWNAPVKLPSKGQPFGLLPDANGGVALIAEVVGWGGTSYIRRFLQESDDAGQTWTEREILGDRRSYGMTLMPLRLADGRPAYVTKEYSWGPPEGHLGHSFYSPSDLAATDWPAEPVKLPEELPGRYKHNYAMVAGRPLLLSLITDQADTILFWISADNADCTSWGPMQSARLPFARLEQNFGAVESAGGAVVAFRREDDGDFETTPESMDVCVTRIALD